jgi:hypothetical protein
MKIAKYMLGVGIGSLFLATTALGDAFANFRAEVQRKIPAAWACGEIGTIEGNTLFDVSSPENRFSIVITRCELISQQEWTLRSGRMKQAVDAIIAGEETKNVDASALIEGMGLPDGRFGGAAMSVGLSAPDVWYPEIGSDDRESKVVLKAILGILKLYKKSEKTALTNPLPPRSRRRRAKRNLNLSRRCAPSSGWQASVSAEK